MCHCFKVIEKNIAMLWLRFIIMALGRTHISISDDRQPFLQLFLRTSVKHVLKTFWLLKTCQRLKYLQPSNTEFNLHEHFCFLLETCQANLPLTSFFPPSLSAQHDIFLKYSLRLFNTVTFFSDLLQMNFTNYESSS